MEWFHVYKLNKLEAIKLIPHALSSAGIKFVKQVIKARFSH